MLIAVSLILFLTVGITSAATVTQKISYSGKLTNAGGTPLTGTYKVTFRLYNVASGGTALATDTHNVTAASGQFTTTLNFPASKYNGQQLYISLQRAPDPEKTPHKVINPVPYALSLRPGAVVTGSGASHVLKLVKSGNGGMGLNVATSGSSSDAIHANASGAGSRGVYGESVQDIGVYGKGNTGGYFTTNADGGTGINVTTNYDGQGITVNTSGQGNGMLVNTSHASSPGVQVFTKGERSKGVRAFTSGFGSTALFAETWGSYSNSVSAYTYNTSSQGVHAYTTGLNSPAVYAWSVQDIGVYGKGKTGGYFTSNNAGTSSSKHPGINVTTSYDYNPGILINTSSANSDGVYACTNAKSSQGINSETFGDDSYAVYARAYGSGSNGLQAWSSKGYAVYADIPGSTGNSIFTNDYIYAHGSRYPTSDVAEFMPVTGDSTPGTVLVIGKGGVLIPSSKAYDPHVAGIVSTAPAVSLGTKEEGNPGEALIAVAGRVPCKVDAANGPVEEGDILTTSSRPGYAMKATNPQVGTVLGKAMGTLESGTGTIEILVTLQ